MYKLYELKFVLDIVSIHLQSRNLDNLSWKSYSDFVFVP